MGVTIVLADDEPDLRMVYTTYLRNNGHSVHEATTGREALERVREIRPQILILDLWMPDLHGLDVLEQLRNDPASSRLQVVILSNLSDAQTRLECFERGASDYLVKGRPLMELQTHLDRLIAADNPLYGR